MKADLQTIALGVVSRLLDAGHAAFFAGGCVRDMLRGVTPHDYDVATSATPEQVQGLFPQTYAVGAHFGVVVVHEDGWDLEVATFRADGLYLDGRRPEGVTFSTPQQDAERRDFTVNGMFYDPIQGEVIDFVGGRADLECKVLRAIGDPASRFAEDKLRLLRAVRFAATLHFDIEPATWEAVCRHAREIHMVSAERIREELVRIFVSPSRVRGFDLLDASGLLREILPEVERLKGCEQPPQFHPEGDVFVHTRIMLDLLPPVVSVPLVFSVLLHDIGKPPTFAVDPTGRIRFNGHDQIGARMAGEVMMRLKFSRAEIDATVAAVENHMVFKDVKQMRPAKVRRFLARPHIEDELELHRVDCASSHGGLDNYDFLREQQAALANEPVIPPPLVTGGDVLALGWKPGPKIGEILEQVQTRQLENGFANREEALDWISREFPPQ